MRRIINIKYRCFQRIEIYCITDVAVPNGSEISAFTSEGYAYGARYVCLGY